jgi:geranylgeranyl reductase family protein
MDNVAIKPTYDADVIIAGAGPAGAAAACHLAKLGASVILCDRKSFPRDKVCGDFVGPSALIELDRLGIAQMDGFAQTNIGRRGAIFVNGEELISKPFPAIEGMPPYGRVIPRYVLDKFIVDAAQRAGARLIEGARITNCKVGSSAVTVEAANANGGFALCCKLLIGADGGSSTVARILRGSAPPRRDRFIASRAYFTNIHGPEDRLDLYFNGSYFPGYYWLFPTGNGEANAGLGIALETVPPHSQTPAVMLQRLMRDDPALSARLGNARLRGKIAGWPLFTYNHRLPIVFDRVMLIGDAAGLINPLNGEGIQYALMSARWAAEALAPCLRTGDFTALGLAPYAARVESELRYDMALARLIIQLTSNRALTPVWIEVFKILAARARKDDQFADTVSGIFAGLTPARDVLKVVGGTIEEAAQTFVSNTAAAAFRGPREWAHLALSGAHIGFELASSAVRDPLPFAEWLGSAVSSAFEYGSQAFRNARAERTKETVRFSQEFTD